MAEAQARLNNYETVYIFKSDISDASAASINEKIDSVVARFGGKIKNRDEWGLKELAYPIDRATMGRYYVVVYTGTSGVVEEIERHFKILPEVIRFISVAVEADYDYDKQIKAIQQAEEDLKRSREMRKREGRDGFGGGGRDGGGFGGGRDGGFGGGREGGFGGGREGGGFRGEKGGSERGA